MKFSNLIFYLLPSFGLASGYSFTSLYCYRCVSTHPGCGTPFNWLWYWSQPCPEKDDRCVKITEKKDGTEIITRDCLSSLTFRRDIPADHYEGCRPAAIDPHLAHYVNNSITEYDIRRDYYTSTEWCFCYFDNRCNGTQALRGSIFLIFTVYFIKHLLYQH